MNAVLKKIIFFYLTVFCFVWTFTAAKAQTPDGENAGATNLLIQKSVTGAWKINYEESDDIGMKIQSVLQSKMNISASTETQNSKQMELPPLSISLIHPETLVLAATNNTELTINEGYKGFVQTRTIIADGKAHAYEMRAGVDYIVTANGKTDRLVVETQSPRGNLMIETYEITPAANKLKVTVRIEDGSAHELLTLRRVYDRTLPDIFSGGGTEIQ